MMCPAMCIDVSVDVLCRLYGCVMWMCRVIYRMCYAMCIDVSVDVLCCVHGCVML